MRNVSEFYHADARNCLGKTPNFSRIVYIVPFSHEHRPYIVAQGMLDSFCFLDLENPTPITRAQGCIDLKLNHHLIEEPEGIPVHPQCPAIESPLPAYDNPWSGSMDDGAFLNMNSYSWQSIVIHVLWGRFPNYAAHSTCYVLSCCRHRRI